MTTNQFSRRRTQARPTTAKEALSPDMQHLYKKLTVRIPPDLHHRLKMSATAQGVPIAQIVQDLITDYVEG